MAPTHRPGWWDRSTSSSAGKTRRHWRTTPDAWATPAAVPWSSISRPSLAPGVTSTNEPTRLQPSGPTWPLWARRCPTSSWSRRSWSRRRRSRRDTSRSRSPPTTAGPSPACWPRSGPTPSSSATPARTASRSRSPGAGSSSRAGGGRRSCRPGWSMRWAPGSSSSTCCDTSWRSPSMARHGPARCGPTRRSSRLPCPITNAGSITPG